MSRFERDMYAEFIFGNGIDPDDAQDLLPDDPMKRKKIINLRKNRQKRRNRRLNRLNRDN